MLGYPRTESGRRLDFTPGSTLHAEILNRLLTMAQDGYSAISSRHESWKKIDRVMTAFMPKDDMETAIKESDSRKPVSLVIPIEYAMRETALTYYHSQLLGGDFYFPLQPTGPEDAIGCMLLQHELQQQALRSKMELAFNIQWSDALSYGIGLLMPKWQTHTRRPRRGEGGSILSLVDYEDQEPVVAWEGNKAFPIDPYLYIPDPSVPVQDMQSATFVGFMTIENRLNLIAEEHDGNEPLFNTQYLKEHQGRSQFVSDNTGRYEREDSEYIKSYEGSDTQFRETVHCLNMMVNLIPSEWELGKSELPEKWYFKVANDSLVIQAEKLGHQHDLFPVVVCAPTFDGYSIAPISKAELLYPLQEALDFFISASIMLQRKAVNGKTIINQHMIRMDDMLKQDVRYVRMKSNALGVNADIKQFVHQLEFRGDVVQRNMEMVQFLMGVIDRIYGFNEIMQGGLANTDRERVTGTEIRAASDNGLGRMNHSARMSFIMSVRDMAHMLASNTIQYKSKESFVKVLGDWPMVLMSEYGIDINQAMLPGGRMPVSPSMLDVDYDIVPYNGNGNQVNDPQTSLLLLREVMSNPLLMQRFDVVRIFKSLARKMGESNIGDFELPPVQVQVMPGEQAANMEADGELQRTA